MMKRTWRTTIMVFMLPIAVIPTSVKAQNQQNKQNQNKQTPLNQAKRGNSQKRVASQKADPSKSPLRQISFSF